MAIIANFGRPLAATSHLHARICTPTSEASFKRVWSSGYDVRLTRERSWVRSSLPVCHSVIIFGFSFVILHRYLWKFTPQTSDFRLQTSNLKPQTSKSAGALPAGSWISVIMFPRHRRLTHTTTSLIHLTLCLLSAFHYCHHQSDHSSSKAERQWCSHFCNDAFRRTMFNSVAVHNGRPTITTGNFFNAFEKPELGALCLRRAFFSLLDTKAAKSGHPESNQGPSDVCSIYSQMLYQLSYSRSCPFTACSNFKQAAQKKYTNIFENKGIHIEGMIKHLTSCNYIVIQNNYNQ